MTVGEGERLRAVEPVHWGSHLVRAPGLAYTEVAGIPCLVRASDGVVQTLTPTWAAIWALLDQAKGGTGLPSPHAQLYQMGVAAGATAFHDITTGNNSAGVTPGYTAVAGFDLATGWGTPNLPNLIANWP
jgi:hypothetical protein